MNQNLIRVTSWLAGIGAVAAIVWYAQPGNFVEAIGSLRWQEWIGWILLTLIARFLLGETTVAPLKALGFSLPRMDAFWIGWIRTFANQILPLSGLAAYAQIVRKRIQMSWSELAALAASQFVLAAAALGIIGLFATAANFHRLESLAYVLAIAYLVVLVVAIATASGAAWFIGLFPETLSSRAIQSARALRRLVNYPGLVAKMVAYHGLVILSGGARLWILFSAAGVTLDWQELLLVLAISESSMLINVTPGGLGVREGFVISGSVLLGIPAPIAANVALVDRLFSISITTLLTAPAIAFLRAK